MAVSGKKRPKMAKNNGRKSRQLLQEITATSARNHGNFFKKSRQLLQEITATSSRNHGNFCNFST